MPKILITGSNGFLGQKLLLGLRNNPDFSVVAVSRSEDRSQDPASHLFERLDITDLSQVNRCFEKHKPAVVLHTAALSLADPCEKNPEDCWKTNVIGTEYLVEAAEKCGSHFILLSTDFVFDGEEGPYAEEDVPNPLSMYGKSKRAAEQVVMKSRTPWAVARTILVYGTLPVMPRPNIIHFIKNSLQKNETVRIVSDQFRMPTLAEDLVYGCLKIAQQKAEGIFHLSGNEMISVYDFAKLIAEVFHLKGSLIQPVLTADLREAAKRPPKTGFKLDKAVKTLGYRPHSLREGLEMVRKQLLPAPL